MSFITNALGSIGSIAGGLIGGPVGSAIGGAAGNMITGAIDGSGGSSGTPTQTGTTAAPYSVQNSLANLAQEVGPASAAMQVANSDEQLANSLQNNALTSENNQTTNAQNSLQGLYSQIPNPLSQSYNVSQVAPQTLSSVMGPGQGQLPQIYSPQPTPYATQVATMAASPSTGFQQAPIAAQQPITTSAPTAGASGSTLTAQQQQALAAAATAQANGAAAHETGNSINQGGIVSLTNSGLFSPAQLSALSSDGITGTGAWGNGAAPSSQWQQMMTNAIIGATPAPTAPVAAQPVTAPTPAPVQSPAPAPGASATAPVAAAPAQAQSVPRSTPSLSTVYRQAA